MAITPNFTHLINIPFAENGLKETVIEQITSAINTVPPNAINMSDGYTALYKKPIDEGGYSIEMEKFNYVLWKAYSAIKELQTLLTSGQFTAQEALTATSAQTAGTITSTLPISNGGTGATTVEQARINFGITDVEPYNPKVKFSPAVFTQGQTYSFNAIIGAFARLFGGAWVAGDMFPIVYSQGTTYGYGFFKVDTSGTFSLLYSSSSAQIVNGINLEMPVSIYGDGIAATPTGGGEQPAPEPITYSNSGAGTNMDFTHEVPEGYTSLTYELHYSCSGGDYPQWTITNNSTTIYNGGFETSGTEVGTASITEGTLTISMSSSVDYTNWSYNLIIS